MNIKLSFLLSFICLHSKLILAIGPADYSASGVTQLSTEETEGNLTIKCQANGAIIKKFKFLLGCHSVNDCDEMAKKCLNSGDKNKDCSVNGNSKNPVEGEPCQQQENGQCYSIKITRKQFISGYVQCDTNRGPAIDYIYEGTDGQIYLLVSDASKQQILTQIEVTKGSIVLQDGGILYPNDQISINCKASKIPSNGSISFSIIHGDESKTSLGTKSSNDSMDFYVRQTDTVTIVDGMTGFSCSSGVISGVSDSKKNKADFYFDIIYPNKPSIINEDGQNGTKIFNYGDIDQQLLCNLTDAHPMPEFKWFHNGTAIQLAQHSYSTQVIHYRNRSIELTQAILILPEITYSLSGNYTVQATNSAGSVRFEFNVTTYSSKAKIVHQNGTTNFSFSNGETETEKLYCIASGVPRPKITWYLNGTALNTTSKPCTHHKCFWSGIKWSLVDETIGGTYECIVENPFGKDKIQFNVKVYSSKPTILNKSRLENEKKVIFYKESIHRNISCDATGAPRPDITWFYNGKPFDGFTLNSGPNLTRQSSISWPWTANVSDAGKYKCIAQNKFGTDQLEFNVDFSTASGPSTGISTHVSIIIGFVILTVGVVSTWIFMYKKSIIKLLRDRFLRMDVDYQPML